MELLSIDMSRFFPSYLWGTVMGLIYIVIPIRCIFYFIKGNNKEGVIYLIATIITGIAIYIDLYQTYWID